MPNADDVASWWMATLKWFKSIGSGTWSPLYDSRDVEGTGAMALFAWLASPDNWIEPSGNWSVNGWDAYPDGFAPYLDEGSFVGVNDQGLLAIVLRDEFEHTSSSCWYPAEDLRIAYRLRPTDDHQSFLEADEAGSEEQVLRFDRDQAQIKTGLLHRYAAARQMDVIFSVVIDWALPEPARDQEDNSKRYADHDCFAQAWIGEKYARFVGRKRISAPPIDQSFLPPFEAERTFLDFIVDEDVNGNEIEANAGDANYAGPVNYLTPVFFDREVLRRYRESPSQFRIADGIVGHASGLWGLRSVDMNHPDYVVVFLGDLKALPTKEQRHWRTHNLKPADRKLSETQIRRDFLGEFADPSSPDLQLRQLYPVLNSEWKAAFGAPLWRDPHRDDSTILDQISVLISQDVSEFDTMIIRLQKVLIEFLNPDWLLPDKGAGSITRLETTLQHSGFDTGDRLSVLRDIQGLRTKGAAHRRGREFDFTKAGIEELRAGFAEVLADAVELLNDLREFAATSRGSVAR